ncbi:MAG TPA: DUF4123 domain-containing protein [Pyrinomonadaceae bacterium]|jgi:RHS repeat-associated protein|nr:DUF4123 domain-containing protein [Pyrinomonadaceae bacterium]
MDDYLSQPPAANFTNGVEAGSMTFGDLQRLAHTGALYAVIDACDAPDVPAKVASLGSAQGACLYRGHAAENFADKAPHLARVDGALLDWIKQTLWTQPWGFFFTTTNEFPEVNHHWRKFITVTSPDGSDLLFRYYDPRLLPLFLSSCDAAELKEFFGDCDSLIIFTEEIDGQALRLSRALRAHPMAPPRRPTGQNFPLRAEHLYTFRRKNFGDALIQTFDKSNQTAKRDPASGDILIKDARGHEMRMGFDRLGFIGSVTSPLQRTWRMENDGEGKLLQLTTPSAMRLQLTYDGGGQLERAARDGRELFRAAHDDFGRLKGLSFPDQTSAEVRYRYAGEAGIHDEDGKYVAATTDRLRQTERFAYSNEDNLTAFIDGNGNTTRFEYGVWRRPDRALHADGSVEEYGYDPLGQLQRMTSQSGNEVALTYDASGRIRLLRGSDGVEAAFVYDDAGRLTKARSADSTVNYKYDDEGRVVEEEQDGERILYRYDESGTLTHLTYPTGEIISYEHDADMRLSGLIDWRGRRYEIAYADDDRGWTFTSPDKLVTTVSQSPVGLTTSISIRRATDSSVVFHSEVEYDGEDRISQMRDSRFGRRHYEYDSEGQLLSVERLDAPHRNEVFAYDAAGNRVGSNGEHAVFNSLNQLVSQGALQCIYDGRGNLIEQRGGDDNWKYTYDSFNRMIGAEDERGGQKLSFGYDAFGRRVWKKSVVPDPLNDARSTSLTRYVWAGEQLVREVTEKTTTQTTGHYSAPNVSTSRQAQDYLYWPQTYTPMLLRVGDQIYQYHMDHLGTPRRLTDEQGATVWEADYAAYGAARLMINKVAQPLRLPGQYEDAETRLHYNRFRYYDPSLGRYLTRDPASYLSGLNLYLYCSNNPVNDADPLGLWPSWSGVKNFVKKAAPIVAAVAVAAIVVATAPVSGPLLIIAAGVAAGVTYGVLNEGMENGFGCLSCLAKAGLKGGIVGGLAAVPFAFLPAAAGVAAYAGVGGLSGGIGYMSDWAVNGADPKNFSWKGLATSVGIGAGTAGVGRYVGPKISNWWNTREPTEPYSRSKYGSTPTQADRRALGAGAGDVVDHDPPLVKRYYEGDKSIGEKPGYKMTDEELKASANDRSRMKLQPKDESNKQGGEMSKYSKDMKKKYGLK